MAPLPPLHVERLGSGPRVVFVHGSTGDGRSFDAQRRLADRFSLELVDRRGFGGSSDPKGRVDFDRDALDIVEILGPAGAHLVGHSYGGVASLVAAGRAPQRVRSLTVIEPPAFGVIGDHPAGAVLRQRLEPIFPAPPTMTPSTWDGAFSRALGFPSPDPVLSPPDERNVRSSMTERPPWEAEIPLAAIRAAGVRVLVVRGGWEPLPQADAIGGAFFEAVCDRLASQLDSEVAAFPGTFHGPHREDPAFNDVLANFVARAEAERSVRDDDGATDGDAPASSRGIDPDLEPSG